MSRDPIIVHREWLGYVQPTGLVVSIPALVEASAVLNQNYGPGHQRFLSALPQNGDGEPIPEIQDFVRFAQEVLNWDASLLVGAPGSDLVPGDLEVNLENYNETLRPTYALRNLEGDSPWLLLVSVLPTGTDLDEPHAPHDRGWQASPQVRFERLLRQTRVPVGLLVNGREIRLVYAPEKELSGHITFKLAEMVQVAGRPILAALLMLLDSERLYSVADKERLPAILANSRKYQNVVSTQLAEQVLEALYELLRGFQAANDQLKGELLRDVLGREPNHVYGGLLTTLLRLVFVLYAEDRGLLSTDPIYSNYYSVTGLYERLRGDDGRYKDTMDQRYGAWAQLLALFRLIYSGGSHGAMKIPAREGYLFDPDRYLFLEGRHSRKDKPEIPRVPDGVVYRVLSKLLLLDGERLSYRTLAVEQIGSVYEAIMGFELQVAAGQSIAIKPAKRHGAPATVNLDELLRTPADKRQKWFTETTDQKLTGQATDGLRTAVTIEELLVALDRKIAKKVTPNVVQQGAMIFQPSNERRKSGSHYTPRSLTEPIVEAALQPVLRQLGENPTPEQILNLKVCDPAMGSGAFLVEACRQLGDALAKAWHAHNDVPPIPPDEDEALFAQRVIAQRCLYGVDKNPMAVDLAKLSLWLATLARNHPFTFLDHSLRHGDSLVGLTREQIAAFHWQPAGQHSFFEEQLRKDIERVSRYRQRILAAREDRPYSQLRQELDGADESLRAAREVGDTVIAAFFSAEKPKDRENKLFELRPLVETALKHPTAQANDVIERSVAKLRRGPKGIAPFHWQLEFPEVFDGRGQLLGGFDALIGNPPFMGGAKIWPSLGVSYRDWLRQIHTESGGKAVDLVAHFFRRSFDLVRQCGTVGLVATNTISQGDTREAGLRYICLNRGSIFAATRRLCWPGQAAVIVSLIHIIKGPTRHAVLDGVTVPGINSFLFPQAKEFEPVRLACNLLRSFRGCDAYGQGFLFDDLDTTGFASSLGDMRRLIEKDPTNEKRIFPFIGGKELTTDPRQKHHRYAINFGNMSLDEAEKWPELLAIVRRQVKPSRDSLNGYSVAERRRDYWWQYGTYTPALYNAIEGLDRVLAISQTTKYIALAFLPARMVFSHKLIVFPVRFEHREFCVLQSRMHEMWAIFRGSTMKDDPVYSTPDCFETYPFPQDWEYRSSLELAGRAYHDFRAGLMVKNGEGLTQTYNRFHDPDERDPDILTLRELHAGMDRAVLDAYNWNDIRADCEFLLNYEIDDDDSGDKKKPWRYRWPDETNDEVLARLLELNRQFALREGQLVSDDAATYTGGKPKKTIAKKSKAKTLEPTATPTLFAKGAGEV